MQGSLLLRLLLRREASRLRGKHRLTERVVARHLRLEHLRLGLLLEREGVLGLLLGRHAEGVEAGWLLHHHLLLGREAGRLGEHGLLLLLEHSAEGVVGSVLLEVGGRGTGSMKGKWSARTKQKHTDITRKRKEQTSWSEG
jgi:hypothetical protein